MTIAALAAAISAPRLGAWDFLDSDTRQLLIDAVEVAAELDFYYARCRGDSSGRRTDNLNKVLVSKYRKTVLAVEDDLFPYGSYLRTRERLQEQFLERLKAAGGCQGAKEAGIPGKLRERYDRLMREIERAP